MAVFALGALVVASGSAATTLLAEWLIGNTAIVEENVESSAIELLLEDTKAGLFGEKSDVLCSGILDGTIGLNGTDLTTKLLSLGGTVETGTALSGQALEGCVSDALCENGNPDDIKVWALNLPWLTTVELMIIGTETFFVDLIAPDGAGNPGWYVECLVGGLFVQDDCTAAEGIVKLTNEANGTVDAMFEEAFTELAGLELGTCEKGGAKTGVVEGLGTISVAGGGLSVSSE